MSEENTQQTQETTEEVNGAPTSAGTETTEQQAENTPEQKIPYDRFKAKVDEVNTLKERLDAFEQQQAEAERKRLEEAENYRELAESYKAELDTQKEAFIGAKKDTLLSQAGYNTEQIAFLRGNVTGDTDEEITNSIEQLKTAFPTKPAYVDPSPMNGAKDKAEPADATEIGANAWERVKNRLR